MSEDDKGGESLLALRDKESNPNGQVIPLQRDDRIPQRHSEEVRRAARRKRPQAEVRRREAFALRLAGATYDDIGRALGVTRQSAWELVQKTLEEIRTETKETVEQIRQVELSRLDSLLIRLLPKAQEGDLSAIDRVIRISERRARLVGLDQQGGNALGVSVQEGDEGVEVKVVYVDEWRTD